MTTVQNRLSILIPSIPSRLYKAASLYNRIVEQTEGMDVQILMLTDNKLMTIGEKCNYLLSMVTGKYFIMLHDDDELTDIAAIYAATEKDVDVITYNAECKNNDGSTYIVTQGLGNDVEHNTKDGGYLDCKRPPFPNCAWANKFKHVVYAEVSYSEDWQWVQQALSIAKTEHHIDKTLFKYNFSAEQTEASTQSNAVWTNPNVERIVKRCVINLSTEKYWAGQDRLVASIGQYEVLAFRTEAQVGAPPHSENNYAFKVYSFIKAYELGYRQILWLDASMRAIKDITPIFDIIDKDGYFFQDSGWTNERWTNKAAKEYFGHAKGRMLSGGVLGLDLTNPLAYKFFDLWSQAMRCGVFNGDWSDFRHDQSCASLIAYDLGMKLQDDNTFFSFRQQ